MSVAAASGAVGTQQHQPTAEQIRLAQLIDDKKHNQPEIQAIIARVRDVVAYAEPDDILLALHDCDYDYERTVALIIEKGRDIASEWRTATNHKTNKKHLQKTSSNKTGHGRDTDENGQQQSNDGPTNRGQSRGGGGRSRFQHSQNGGDSQNPNPQQSDYYTSQNRTRAGGSGFRSRPRGGNRGTHRGGGGRNYQQHPHEQPQDSNVEGITSSDTRQHAIDASALRNRRGRGSRTRNQLDVGKWNGETLIYSRSIKDEEQDVLVDNNNASYVPSETQNGQSSSVGTPTVNNVPELNIQPKPNNEFDADEAARQIKNSIGIGQSQKQNSSPPKPLMDLKPIVCDSQMGQQPKPTLASTKPGSQNVASKVTPPPRIPHQPVIFSDRFDGGINKIDIQFGNLSESSEEMPSKNVSVPAPSAAVFYPRSEPTASIAQQKPVSSSVPHPQRATTAPIAVTAGQHQTTEQSTFASPTGRTTATRSSEQQQQHQQHMTNSQRVMAPPMPQQQQQQPSMTMKTVVQPQYAIHHQQHQLNPANLLRPSLLYHPQHEPVPLDTSYDTAGFALPPMDFSSSYFMAPMSQQPPQSQAQPRFLVPQPHHQQQQQITSNRQQSSTNVQTPPLSSSSSIAPSSTSTVSSTAPKKGPAVPPGIFLSTTPSAQAAYPTAYSTTYGVPFVGRQQQPGGATYSTTYEPELLFTNPLIPLTSAQQTQSPTGTYGSVTPPVQQQTQQHQTHANNDNKTINYGAPIPENILWLQQFQQYGIQQSNSQQQGSQAAHSPAQQNHPFGLSPSGPSFPPGAQMVYDPSTPAAQQQQHVLKQSQQYNPNTAPSTNKEPHHMYKITTQSQQTSSASVGQHQGVTKPQQQQQQQQTQHQQRGSGNVYNNQQNQQHPFQ